MEFVGLTTYAESGTPEGVPIKYGLTSEHIVQAAKQAIARKG
jgi:transketolase